MSTRSISIEIDSAPELREETEKRPSTADSSYSNHSHQVQHSELILNNVNFMQGKTSAPFETSNAESARSQTLVINSALVGGVASVTIPSGCVAAAEDCFGNYGDIDISMDTDPALPSRSESTIKICVSESGANGSSYFACPVEDVDDIDGNPSCDDVRAKYKVPLPATGSPSTNGVSSAHKSTAGRSRWASLRSPARFKGTKRAKIKMLAPFARKVHNCASDPLLHNDLFSARAHNMRNFPPQTSRCKSIIMSSLNLLCCFCFSPSGGSSSPVSAPSSPVSSVLSNSTTPHALSHHNKLAEFEANSMKLDDRVTASAPSSPATRHVLNTPLKYRKTHMPTSETIADELECSTPKSNDELNSENEKTPAASILLGKGSDSVRVYEDNGRENITQSAAVISGQNKPTQHTPSGKFHARSSSSRYPNSSIASNSNAGELAQEDTLPVASAGLLFSGVSHLTNNTDQNTENSARDRRSMVTNFSSTAVLRLKTFPGSENATTSSTDSPVDSAKDGCTEASSTAGIFSDSRPGLFSEVDTESGSRNSSEAYSNKSSESDNSSIATKTSVASSSVPSSVETNKIKCEDLLRSSSLPANRNAAASSSFTPTDSGYSANNESLKGKSNVSSGGSGANAAVVPPVKPQEVPSDLNNSLAKNGVPAAGTTSVVTSITTNVALTSSAPHSSSSMTLGSSLYDEPADRRQKQYNVSGGATAASTSASPITQVTQADVARMNRNVAVGAAGASQSGASLNIPAPAYNTAMMGSYYDYIMNPNVLNSEECRRIMPQSLITSGGRVLLPPADAVYRQRKCLVLDLDETLVHSSFQQMGRADFVVPVRVGNMVQDVYVLKRPGVDEFLRRMGEIYEVVIFTASLPSYADAVIDLLDKYRVVKHRLFRDSCVSYHGSFVKNLSCLGRDLQSTAIVDNSHFSYAFHVSNAIPILSWFDDPSDTELFSLGHMLNDMSVCEDVPQFLTEKKMQGVFSNC